MDFSILSSVGFTDDDVLALKSLNEVSSVMPAYRMDYLVSYEDADDVFRIHSLPDNLDSNNESYINQLTLVSGRLPEKDNECVLGAPIFGDDNYFQVGDKFDISSTNSTLSLDMLKEREFEVVGIVDSPIYVSKFLGATDIGSGSIANFAYVNESAFDSEYYTQLFVRGTDLISPNSFSDEYTDTRDALTPIIEKLGDERVDIRYDDILSTATEELSDAKSELADAKKKLSDGKKEADEKLYDAELEIQDAEKEIADGKQKITDGYAEIAQNESKLSSAQKEVYNARAELQASKALLNQKQNEYNAGYKTYSDNYAKFSEQKTAYDNALAGANALEGLANSMPSMLGAMQQSLSLLPPNVSEPDPEALATFNGSYSSLIASMGGASQALGAISDPNAQAIKGNLDATIANASSVSQDENYYQNVYNALSTGLNSPLGINGILSVSSGIKAELSSQKPALDAAEKELAAAKATLDTAKAQLDAGFAELNAGEAKLNASQSEINSGLAEISSAKQVLKDSEAEIADAEVKLEEGKIEYDTEKEKADKEIADAEKEIRKGEKQIKSGEKRLQDLQTPKWYVFDRDSNTGYAGFLSDSKRISAIAAIIPPFFFLVAALVCLTTMTRMVEDERMEIGTKKALGFSKFTIAFKYIFYAGTASFLGAAIGIVIGIFTFPTAIWNAYGIMYIMPKVILTGNGGLVLFTFVASLLTVTIPAIIACYGELMSVPAELMRPKAPKAGKRVIIERITPIWKRLKFSHKVTARNLFRNKKRVIMTMLGVMGCTALLLVGFALDDATSGIVPRQFDVLNKYDAVVTLADPVSIHAGTSLDRTISEVGEGIYIQQTSINVESKKVTTNTLDTSIFVFEDIRDIEDYFTFQNRKSGEKLEFPRTDGVIVTEKLASWLDVKSGDSIHISTQETDGSELTGDFIVSGVTENYLDHIIYMSSNTYKDIFGENPTYNGLRVIFNENGDREDMLKSLVSDSNVAAAVDVNLMRESASDVLVSINAVVWLIILAAAMLAFVVLYNLTNISITERTREMATLMVLGFYDKEVAAYVFRENIILTIIGIALGLVGGFFLAHYVIITIEVDDVMFRRSIKILSYVFSALFTLGVTILVDLFMIRRLRKIDMVESLKSTE